jgi:hypothetical protein
MFLIGKWLYLLLQSIVSYDITRHVPRPLLWDGAKKKKKKKFNAK